MLLWPVFCSLDTSLRLGTGALTTADAAKWALAESSVLDIQSEVPEPYRMDRNTVQFSTFICLSVRPSVRLSNLTPQWWGDRDIMFMQKSETTVRSWFCPSTMSVPGIQLTLSDFGSKCLYRLGHLARTLYSQFC